jgi:hypothetical protein
MVILDSSRIQNVIFITDIFILDSSRIINATVLLNFYYIYYIYCRLKSNSSTKLIETDLHGI